MKIKPWIEAMRLRTLPVSATGVFMASACGVINGCVKWLPAALCLLFALLAQIVSNFANEYYDYKAGLDKPGRVGPRRGVTEGDITPKAMKCATYITLGIAALVGLTLVYWGGWWLIGAGLLIGIGALAYSSGPVPLSRYALGEVAVIVFFGIVPVNLTYYLFSLSFTGQVFWASLAVGLMGANILVVNNYRDRDDDKAVGKHTIATVFGRGFASALYLFFGLAAVGLLLPEFLKLPSYFLIAPAVYVIAHIVLFMAVLKKEGSGLNPVLGMTVMNMFLFSLLFLIFSLIHFGV